MATQAALRRLRSLRDKRHREELGLFAVEGAKVVGELLDAGYPFQEIYATPEWAGPRTAELTPAEMARASHFPTPSPVLAVGRIESRPLPEGALDRGLTLALDGVQDPGNVGTLLRVADWYALDRVVLSPECADLHSQKVIQASMGSFARIAVHTANLREALRSVRAPVIGCALEGTDVHELPPAPDAILVIGAEGRGLSEGVQRLLTRTVTIPRYGKAESLNAALAGAIVCDILRRALRDS